MTAGLPKRAILRLAVLVLLLALSVEPAVAVAGDTVSHIVIVQIPEAIRLVVETGDAVFDLAGEKEGGRFPPETYPAYYYPSSSEGEGAVILRVYSNSLRQWAVYVKPLGDLTDGTNVIPISRLEWSIDRVNWTSLPSGGSDGFGVRLFAGSQTNGWEYFRVYYRLRLTGDEVAGGAYKAELKYSIVSL